MKNREYSLTIFDKNSTLWYNVHAFEREIIMLNNQLTTTTKTTKLKSIGYIGCFSIAK